MHEYAHKEWCRVALSHCRAEGIGKVAGEKTETLWSDLNSYASSQRAMTLENRLDHLSFLLASIGYRINARMRMHIHAVFLSELF